MESASSTMVPLITNKNNSKVRMAFGSVNMVANLWEGDSEEEVRRKIFEK